MEVFHERSHAWRQTKDGINLLHLITHYSARNITAGSMCIARNTAGNKASNAAPSNTAHGIASMETSVPFTPYKSDSTYRTETNPRKFPTTAPSMTIAIIRMVTSRAM